MSGAKPPFP